jgi:nifR3 family TIM-barrel protein
VSATHTVPGALAIGPLVVDPPVVLAPMAGVTNAAFRELAGRFGALLGVSEMVTARALVERHRTSLAMVARADGVPRHSVQLYGVDPQVMDRAVRILVDEIGADHVDLNFGCPASKVTRKGGGAALPVHHVLFGRIVAAAVAAAGTVPVTVKMRMGLNDHLRTDQRAGRIAADAGVAAVALHARTAEQLYSGAAHWDAIGELKQAVGEVAPGVPVLGNGDVFTGDDALAMVRATGCDGVVIGRGCLGRPWLFAELAAAFTGAPEPPQPTLAEVVAVMRDHLAMLCANALAGSGRAGVERRTSRSAGRAHLVSPPASRRELAAVRDFRKHIAWYLLGFPIGRETRRRLMAAGSHAELDAGLAGVLDVADGTQQAPASVRRTPRSHTNGPRPISLPAGWLDNPEDPHPPAGADSLVSGG